jgi:hypothetical protein
MFFVVGCVHVLSSDIERIALARALCGSLLINSSQQADTYHASSGEKRYSFIPNH